MESIEVGEYVRTEIGTIGKVVRINEIYFTIENNRGEIDVLYEGNQKHSKNILDLIEEGDYVNGQKVISKTKISVWAKEDVINKNQIISIVTGEQFENMEYKL